ncbi:hypothetical protein I549_4326 [Mycobacterium avium subsp. avium 2285 (R)]|nr:hypothetical protein I549_4326 [Mycobacterium avium subsp. avium 2285 (R)]
MIIEYCGRCRPAGGGQCAYCRVPLLQPAAQFSGIIGHILAGCEPRIRLNEDLN